MEAVAVAVAVAVVVAAAAAPPPPLLTSIVDPSGSLTQFTRLAASQAGVSVM